MKRKHVGKLAVLTPHRELVAPVRVPKAASRAICKAMGLPEDSRHRPAKELRLLLGEKAVIFAVVRHPLARLVSWHAYHTQTEGLDYPPFDEWIKDGCQTHWPSDRPNPLQQTEWTDGADKVFWLEDAGSWCDWLDILCQKRHEVHRVNTSRHRPWQECYTPEMLELAKQITKKDLETYGYTA